jgi:type I restriction enzyme, S subunit
MTGTSGRQRVPPECFRNYPVALPAGGIASRFDEITAPIFAQIRSNAAQSRTLTALRDSLLPRLLSGEVQIKSEKSYAVG